MRKFYTLLAFVCFSTSYGMTKRPDITPPEKVEAQPATQENKAQAENAEPTGSDHVAAAEQKPDNTEPAAKAENVVCDKHESGSVSNIIDIQVGLSKLAERSLPGAVNISTTQVVGGRSPFAGGQLPEGPRGGAGSPFDDLFKEFFGQMEQMPRKVQSLGSGFVAKIDGDTAYIVTNYHVVAEAKKIAITLNNRLELDAELHGKDERTDLAVLKADLSKVSADKKPIALNWASSKSSAVGHFVAAIGNAFGLGNTLTFGVISFKGRDLMARKHDYVDDFIQHTAPINMGNSGGALLNMNGDIVGINTAIFTPTGGHVGIGFAIPSDLAQKTVKALIEHGRVRRGWLGLRIQPVENVQTDSEIREKTIIVGGVTAGGPCDGVIQQGDFILKYNGTPLDYNNRLVRLVGETEPGTKVTMEISRKGEKEPRTITITVGESPETPQVDTKEQNLTPGKKAVISEVNLLGLSVRESPDKKGLVIEKIDDLSPSKDVGLQPGDIITEANRSDIKTADDLNKALKAVKDAGGNTILMCIKRGDSLPSALIFKNGQQSLGPVKNNSDEEGVFFVSVKLFTEELRKTFEHNKEAVK